MSDCQLSIANYWFSLASSDDTDIQTTECPHKKIKQQYLWKLTFKKKRSTKILEIILKEMPMDIYWKSVDMMINKRQNIQVLKKHYL